MSRAPCPVSLLPFLMAAAWVASSCTSEDATAVETMGCDAGTCADGSASGENDGSAGSGGGDGAAGQTSGSGAVGGGSGSSGGGDGGSTTGGSGGGGDGGSTSGGSGGGGDGGSAGGSGGRSGGDGGSEEAGMAFDGGDAQSPVPDFTLVVDAPANGDTVQGSVTVRGRAPGFLNVEVWDAQHQQPPLAQATPDDDGRFEMTVDVTPLATGATTWTIHAWDSPPGEPFDQTASVTLALTIGTDSCPGQTCSGHGTCSVVSGVATCSCDEGYRAVGLSCVAEQAGDDGQPDPGDAYVPAGYQLVFSDEFTADTLDRGTWNTLAPWGVQWYGDSNQKQAFVEDAVSLNNGVVTFTAQPSDGSDTNAQPYSSGGITTNGTFTYGYFEARVRVPAGKGLWPAFWLTSSERWPPEWDIFEIIDAVIYGFPHPVETPDAQCLFVEGAAGPDSTYTIADVYGVYHIYGFTWTESDIYWYVDGVLTEHYAINAAAGADDPFWLNISLQVGGDWPGDPDSTTPFPAHMDVDYVRVYQQ